MIEHPFIVAGVITAVLAVIIIGIEIISRASERRAAKIRAEEAPAIERAKQEGIA